MARIQSWGKKSIETASEKTQTLDFINKGFQLAIINMFKELNVRETKGKY